MGLAHTEHKSGLWRLAGWMLVAAFVTAPLLVTSSASAGNLAILSSFNNDGEELDVATYTEGDQIVGLLGMKGPTGLRISITFDKKKLAAFIDMVQRAYDFDFIGWKEAGSYTETDTKSPSHIVVYGGPSLRFSLTDPSVGSLDFTLNPADVAAFQATLNQAEGQLNP